MHAHIARTPVMVGVDADVGSVPHSVLASTERYKAWLSSHGITLFRGDGDGNNTGDDGCP